MLISKLLAGISVLAYIITLLFSKAESDFRKIYLQFILVTFPLIGLRITTVDSGGLTVFDAISVISFPIILFQRKNDRIRLGSYIFMVSVFVFLILLSSLLSLFPAVSAISLFKYLNILFFSSCLLYQCNLDKLFVLFSIKCLRLACLFAMVFMTFQLIFGLSFALFEPSSNASMFDQQIRFPGMFTDPQQNAQFLAMCSFLFLCDDEFRFNRIFRFLFFSLSLIAIFLTGVRAAFLGIIVGLTFITVFGKARLRMAGLIITGVGVFFYMIFKDSVALFNREISSVEMANIRLGYWDAAIALFKKNPFLGIGIGNYQNYVSIYDQDQFWESFGAFEYITHPESGYLKILVELGLPNFFIFLLFIIIPVWKAIKVILLRTAGMTFLCLLVASILCWLISFGTVYSFADIRIFVLVSTLLVIVYNYSSKEEKLSKSYS